MLADRTGRACLTYGRTMCAYRQRGTVLTGHTFAVPLDHGQPGGERIEVPGALRAVLRDAAQELAERESWPRLYDADRLGANEVPVAAAIYFDDMYVPREFSLASGPGSRWAPQRTG
jgi:hypothetical protein